MKINCGCRLITCGYCYPKDSQKPEQQFFSAVIDEMKRVGYFGSDGDFWAIQEETAKKYPALLVYSKSDLTDLVPLTLATPNDVVIRGVTKEELLFFAKTHPIMKIGYSYDFRELKKKLLDQLSPMPEPKEPWSKVEASCDELEDSMIRVWIRITMDGEPIWQSYDGWTYEWNHLISPRKVGGDK